MQLEGLMMMLFFIVVIPIIIMSANHNIFFIFTACILLIAFIREIPSIISQIKDLRASYEAVEDQSAEDEMVKELEDMTNINIKKFSTGISLGKNLIIILFFVYCSFYLDGLLFKLPISAIILFRIYMIISLMTVKNKRNVPGSSIKLYCFNLLCSLLSLFIILSTAGAKFLGI